MNRHFPGFLIFFWASAGYALTPNQWQFRQMIEVPAQALVQLNLPPETLNIARADLSDLRIIDASGKEIPFLIDQPAPRPESILRPKDFRAEIVSAETRLLITTGTDSPLTGVTLQIAPGATFVKAVRVEGSNDQKNWRLLTSGDPIFNTQMGASKLRVSFPESKWQFLCVIVNDNRIEPVPWTGAQLIIGGTQAPTEPVPIKIKSRDENPGMTRIALDLGVANLRLASLRIGTAEPVFTRSITVAVPELSGDALNEQTLCSAVLYRVDLNGKIEARLDIPVEREIHGQELVLLIENGDSPPLAISEIGGARRITRLLFFAPATGSFTLLSGNSQCDLPRYDLTQLGDQLRRVATAEVHLTMPVSNPGYDATADLPQGLTEGAKIDTAEWKFRKPVQIAQTGAQQIELDPDVLARGAADFRDLRLVRENAQLPYLIERTSITRKVALSPSSANDRDYPTLSRWCLKMPQRAVPITRITFASTSPLFERTFRLWEEVADERGDKYPHELARATWRRVPNQPTSDLTVPLESAPRSDNILLETDNGDNPPIDLRDFRGHYPVTRVVFMAATPQSIALYYGNDGATLPRYDVKLIAGKLLRSQRASPALGALENLKTERVAETLSGSARYIFWGVLGIVVIALLILISRLLPKTA